MHKAVCISVVVVVGMKITSLGDLGSWATCKVNESIGIGKSWPQYASNCLTQATSVTNSAFLPMPVDHTYLVGHVLSAHAHNWPGRIDNGHQQTLCLYYHCIYCCYRVSDTQTLHAGYCSIELDSSCTKLLAFLPNRYILLPLSPTPAI